MAWCVVSLRSKSQTAREIDGESPKGTSSPRPSASNSSACQYGVEATAFPAPTELEVVLAQRDMTIQFTKTHIADLKTVIQAEGGAKELEAQRNPVPPLP